MSTEESFNDVLAKHAVNFLGVGLSNEKFNPRLRYDFLLYGYSWGGYSPIVPIQHKRCGVFDVDRVLERPESTPPTFIWYENLANINRDFDKKWHEFEALVNELYSVNDLQSTFDKLALLLRNCQVNRRQTKIATERTIDFIKNEPKYFVDSLTETFDKLSRNYALVSVLLSAGPDELVKEIGAIIPEIRAAVGSKIEYSSDGSTILKMIHNFGANKAKSRDTILTKIVGKPDGAYVLFTDDYLLDADVSKPCGKAKFGVNFMPIGWPTEITKETKLPSDVGAALPAARKNFSAVIDFINRYDSRFVEFHYIPISQQINVLKLALKIKHDMSLLISENANQFLFDELCDCVEVMNAIKGLVSSITIGDLLEEKSKVVEQNYSRNSLAEFFAWLEENFAEPFETEEKLIALIKSAEKLISHPEFSQEKIHLL